MTAAERDILRQRYTCCCGYCGVSETDVGAALTVDHFQPISRGGHDLPANWVYCCFACNNAKGNYWQPDSPQRVPHPLQDQLDTHIAAQEDGVLLGLTEIGHFHILLLRLNRPALVAYRVEKRAREREALRQADIVQRLEAAQHEIRLLRARLAQQLRRNE